jgi:uncharacterized protein HemX
MADNAQTTPAEAPAGTTNQIAVPSVSDIAKVSADAGGGLNGIVMALIAVIGGGGAIWKFLQNKEKSKQKKEELDHEIKMKELEIKQASHGNSDSLIKSIETKTASLEGVIGDLKESITSMKAKLNSLLSNSSDVSDKVEELESKISKIEKSIKPKDKK